MPVLKRIPAAICFLLLAAHFMHSGSQLLVVPSLVLCGLLLSRDATIIRIVQVLLVLAAVEWVFTSYDLIQQREANHREWLRAAVILLGVAAFNVAAAACLHSRRTSKKVPGFGMAPPGTAPQTEKFSPSPAPLRPVNRI